MLRHLLRLCLACALLAVSSPTASPNPLTAPAAPSVIDISGLTSFLATLTPDERDEQLRDWAWYGLASRYDAAAEELPIRHPALKGARPRDVSPGRVFPLSAREWAVVLSPELLGNKPLIGGLVDGKCATSNLLPEKIVLFSYTYNAAAANLVITPAGTLDAKDLFTPAYGYHAATVRTAAELEKFLLQVDDLVVARWRPDGLLLGGRKYERDDRRSVTLEEVATLYQAYHDPADTPARAQYEARLAEKYAELVRRDRKVRQALERGTTTRGAVMAQLRRRYRFGEARREVNVGFSLDPDRDYPALAAGIEKLASHVPGLVADQPALASLVASRRRELSTVAERIRSRRDIRPLLALRRRYQSSANPAEQRFGEMLRYTEERHSYQAARYDGRLQGTRAAMILFYTDLLAKLWALDYEGITPKGPIKGLRTMQEIGVPKLYWKDMARLSRTRLWFGLRKDGFDLYGDKLLFQPVATRVYAASFDPMTPGRESLPNYQSGEFLGWWDAHYGAVAEYEPYYHKLNQIQKWSALFVVLKEKRSPLLDFLQSVPVTRNLDFATWSRNNATLKARIAIPFLDSRRYGRTTECIPLLSSREYRLMGATYALSGGVSLAARRDILAKLHEHDEQTPAAAGSPGAGRTPATARGARRRSAVPAAPVRTAAPQGLRAPAASRAVRATGRAPAGDGYGTFRAEKQPAAIKLRWDKGPSAAMSDLVSALAARQQTHTRAHTGEGIFTGIPDVQSVVRVKTGSTYLVKSAAIRDRWVYLSVNPANAADYPARAAADTPEADIFCARLVTAAEARKLAAGKAVIR